MITQPVPPVFCGIERSMELSLGGVTAPLPEHIPLEVCLILLPKRKAQPGGSHLPGKGITDSQSGLG